MPTRHIVDGGVQSWSARQVSHAPPLHTWFIPQAVPLSTGACVSPQVGVPLPQLNLPTWHLFAGTQGSFSTQAMHEPLLQTLPASHILPLGAFALSTQTGLPAP